MPKEISNKVRQVLMNELGLTRDSVRVEMEKVVADTVKKHIAQLKDKKFIEEVIGAHVAAVISDERSYYQNTIKRLVYGSAADKASKIFDKMYPDKS